MSTDFTTTLQPGYLHVELAPGYEIRPEGTRQLTLAISDVCARRDVRRVLIEGSVAKREMGTMDSFGLGSLMGSMLTGMHVAMCLYGYAPDGQSQFFRDVAQNRGVRVDFFTERDAALRWLGVAASK